MRDGGCFGRFALLLGLAACVPDSTLDPLEEDWCAAGCCGGKCVDGRCEPVVIAELELGSMPDVIEVGAGRVWFAVRRLDDHTWPASTEIQSCALSTGSCELFAEGGLTHDILVDDDHGLVVWTSEDAIGGVFVASVDGSWVERRFYVDREGACRKGPGTRCVDYTVNLAREGSTVYFSGGYSTPAAAVGSTPGAVYYFGVNGTFEPNASGLDGFEVVPATVAAFAESKPGSIAIDTDGSIWFALPRRGEIRHVASRRSDEQLDPLVVGSVDEMPWPDQLALGDGFMGYAREHEVQRAAVDGLHPPETLAGGQGQTRSVVVDAGSAYWLDADRGEVRRWRLVDGARTTLLTGLGAPFALAQDSSCLYVADRGSDRILAIAKPAAAEVR